MNEVDNFLAHYGVMGMKWGVRKQHQLSDKIGRASGTGKNTQKLEARRKKIAAKQNSRVSEKTAARIKSLSTSKALTQRILLGGHGSMVYNSAKANRNASTGEAVTQALVSGAINTLSLGYLNRHVKY